MLKQQNRIIKQGYKTVNISETVILATIIGALAGVLSSVIVYLNVLFYRHQVKPRLKAARYKGANVSGVWHCLASDMNREIRIELDQIAGDIKGTATFVDVLDNGDGLVNSQTAPTQTANMSTDNPDTATPG